MAILPSPDHYYGESTLQRPPATPEEDALASRGVPVFRPTMAEFGDFERYLTSIERWGMISGIVKIIPPKEWKDALPKNYENMADVQIKNPIEQRMVGRGGLFRQQNVEKRKTMNLREWILFSQKDGMRAPGVDAVEGRRKSEVTKKVHRPKGITSKAENAMTTQDETEGPTDPSATIPTPPASISAPKSTAEERQTMNIDFLRTFDPRTSWLPEFTNAEDYTPEFCRELERLYWRNCSFGAHPWYGADTVGSLFTDATKKWNVANLPSALTRLLPSGATLPGVNTPYLYLGMWRATFSWHVEDMDLFSINYIHWGAPKFWYAVPQARAGALEEVMKSYFPADQNQCPQFLRHKSYLASPTTLSQSSCRPNTLVQHSGEFVVTFPRGYHAGFNLGLNCAESTNFALDSWIELGRKARVCECVGDSVRIDVEQLIQQRAAERKANRPPRDRKRKQPGDGSDGEDSSWGWLKKARTEGASSNGLTLTRIPSLSSRFIQDATPSASSSKPRPVKPPKPKAPTVEHYTPCCLCPSQSEDDLLPVFEAPPISSGSNPQKDADGNLIWRAHASCARVIPETWIDEYIDDDEATTYVFGVDGIDKDRWTLKCAACTDASLKAHGAPIQCSKGKCSRAFHVSCARTGINGISFRVTGVDDKEVVLTNAGHTDSSRKVIKTISKDLVECYCSQHNPASQTAKKASKTDQLRRDILALEPLSRVKIRSGSGVFEVTLTSVNQNDQTLAVVWDDGGARVFKWSAVVWEPLVPATRPATALPNRNKAPAGKKTQGPDRQAPRPVTQPITFPAPPYSYGADPYYRPTYTAPTTHSYSYAHAPYPYYTAAPSYYPPPTAVQWSYGYPAAPGYAANYHYPESTPPSALPPSITHQPAQIDPGLTASKAGP